MEQKYKTRINVLLVRNIVLTILVGQRIWFIIFDSTYGSSNEPLGADLDYSVFEKWKKEKPLEQPVSWQINEFQSSVKDTESESELKNSCTENEQLKSNKDFERAKVGLWAVEKLSKLPKLLDN
jgi:hypothetical protein